MVEGEVRWREVPDDRDEEHQCPGCKARGRCLCRSHWRNVWRSGGRHMRIHIQGQEKRQGRQGNSTSHETT